MPLRWTERVGRQPDERGAVALLMSFMVVILMISSAFVVDLGMTRVARADVQALADVVALDLARNIDGRTVAELTPVLDAALADSLERNDSVIGAEIPDLTYRLGQMSEGTFEAIASTAVPSAVEVRAHTAVDYAFARVFSDEKGSATRRAAADSSSTACFRLGTFVAAIRSEDSTVLGPLNELLGVNLDLVSYRGLADAQVRLADLAAVPSIGSPEHLLTSDISYADLLRAMVTSLQKDGSGANAVALDALDRLVKSSVTASVGFIRLGDVLHVAPTDVAAMQVGLSVLDIIGTARLADGNYFLGVPNIQGGVPGVGFQFSGALYLVSAAQLACGAPNTEQAKADVAQLDGTVDINFTNLPSMNLAGIGTLQTPKGTGKLSVVAGDGQGALISPPVVHCGEETAEDPSSFTVDVSTGLASYKLTTDLTVGGEVKLTDLLGLNGLTNVLINLLGSILTLPSKLTVEVGVTLAVGTSRPSSSTPVEVKMPPNDATPVSTGGSINLDPSSVVPTVTSVKIGGKPVALLNTVKALTDPIVYQLVSAPGGFLQKSLTELIDNINQSFIGPVARMIGLRLAGADVYGVGVTCGMPRLVG